MTKDKLIIQLKGNWERVKKYRITNDQRTKFERLYDCFEVIGELETGKTERNMIENIKNTQNEIKSIFEKMLKNNYFIDNLKSLKDYSPIVNNTRAGSGVAISDEKDFNTIIDVIYALRNPLRHGKKEYTQRSEQILRIINRIFDKIVAGARLKYLSKSK